jgi:hypothetical protein
MNKKLLRSAAHLFALIASLLMVAGAVLAETVQQRLDAVSARMKQFQNVSAHLPAAEQSKLSSGAQHLLRTAARWDELQPLLTRSGATLGASLNGRPFVPQPGTLTSRQVSDPSTDVSLSRMAGFTQSETSTAWCGHNVLVAYNDSGSFLETLPIPGIGVSFNGYSVSSDGGRTFTDQGYLNPGANVFNFLGGDPVAVCIDEKTFYQSSIFLAVTAGVSVSKSTDGGKTFGDPVQVVAKDPTLHLIDKPWMAADPSNSKNLYVTYTDFDFSGTLCTQIRLAIELVSSTDGGATWSAPTVIDNGCYPNEDQGSNVAVDGAGKVYVAWEQFPAFLPTNEIDIARSTDRGNTFTPKSPVAIVTIVGSPFGLLQGGFRNNEFPSLAIDLSRGGNGPLYVAWNDGGRKTITDAFANFYNFGDAVVSRSDNGGLNWSSPVPVNDDNSNAPSSAGADHYLPAIAVDNSGSLGVCFYDRRLDSENFLIDRECANSQDAGRTWSNHRVTKESFAPSIAADLLVNPLYMGDYDTVAVDSTRRSSGFLGAYGDNTRGNPDVNIGRRFYGVTDETPDQ